MSQEYEWARARYAAIDVDTEGALDMVGRISVSIHCWQGDDVIGFEKHAGALSGGIQVTGSRGGKARDFAELTADFDMACSMIPGKKRLNLHASYLVSNEDIARDQLEPRHYKAWIDYAKARGLGIDFNPTFFLIRWGRII